MIHLDAHMSTDCAGAPLVLAETSTDGAGWRAQYTISVAGAGGLEAAITSALESARTFLAGARYAGSGTRLTAFGDEIPLYIGAEFEAAHFAERVTRARFDAAADAARAAFWEAFAGAYPEATSGDMEAGSVASFEAATSAGAYVWLLNNAPMEAPAIDFDAESGLGCAR